MEATIFFHLFHIPIAVMALLATKSQYVPQPHAGSHFQLNPATATSMFSQPSPTNSEFSEGPGVVDDIR